MDDVPAPALRDGPFLAYAVLCEKVLTEQDGVASLIRIVDRVVNAAAGPDIPAQMPPAPINLMLALCLKSGEARGRNAIHVRLIGPSGLTVGSDIGVPVLFEGDDRGVSAHMNVGFVASDEGLYWFEVRLSDPDVLLTRVPLRVLYQPLSIGHQP